MRLQKPLRKEGLRPGASYDNNSPCFFFPSPRGCAEAAVVRFSPGVAIDCTRLRLAWIVSAGPRSPHGVGAKRDRRSAYWLWTGAAAAEAGEARERGSAEASVVGSSPGMLWTASGSGG
ncbi:uncharacterized protein WM294_012737 isoform 2-T3 [Sarcoramphus papa]